jgi:phosphatidylglycerol:prolipoprotein diacylglycerol transferase
MRPILFHLGEVAVPSFWAAALSAFLVAVLLLRSDVVRRGYDVDLAYDLTLYAYIGGWIGARLFLIPTGWQYFTEDPVGFLLSSSGWVWYGGLIGGVVASWILARRRHIDCLAGARRHFRPGVGDGSGDRPHRLPTGR